MKDLDFTTTKIKGTKGSDDPSRGEKSFAPTKNLRVSFVGR